MAFDINRQNTKADWDRIVNEATKGEYLGTCNRTACQQPPADWYNHSTRKYYCEDCATMLNRTNRKDAMELFGHDLCTKGKND